MLHEWQAGGCLEVGLRFLVPRMRGVIRRDDVDDARGHGRAYGGAVSGRLDGWVAFNLVAEAGVVLFGKPEMVHAGFGGQALALEWRGVEQR